mmetsp:Transcript_3286/g.10834  ORF Transcript_3286/g.10834 Transcript_3286/m.10834 type:complete len:301 (+) Transcript_3286:154-1056(+)
MEKYRIVRELLEAELPEAAFVVSPAASKRDLLSTHCERYVGRFLAGDLTREENRRIGFPWSEAGAGRALSSTGGTIAAATTLAEALRRRDGLPLMTGHIAGGTHHAYFDRGEGFCVFNDIACAANVLLRDFADVVRKVLIVDLDVHQGNGNANLFANDDRVFTFSLHAAANVFSRKETSDLDCELPSGADDDAYLRVLRTYLPLLQNLDPDIVFYQAGVDPSEHDRLGKLDVSRKGLQKRNHLLFSAFERRNIPVVVTMGGGYPRDLDASSTAFTEIIQAHADVYRAAAASARRRRQRTD